MEKNQEVELKLLVSKEDLAKLLDSALFKEVLVAGSKEVHTLVTSCYDTVDLKLRAHGIAFRVRDKGDGSFETTVKTGKKSAAAGLAQRLELNIPLAKPEVRLDGFKELGLGFELSELVSLEEIVKLFTITVERTTYILKYKSAEIEMAIDKGEILCGEKTAPIDEMELELKEGCVEDLVELGECFGKLVTLIPEDKSKFVRGMELLEK